MSRPKTIKRTQETHARPKTAKQIEAEAHVDTLVRRGLEALEQFRELNQEQVDYIVAKASVAALDQHGVLAKHAHEETRRGVFEDKATKNLFACEHVVNNMRHTKTVGVISEDEVSGLTLIAEPVGVICGITPTTNPTSTAIFKSLIALKTRNPIVFAFHPSAQESSAHAAQVVYDAAVAADTGMDVLTHAIEAYVSTLANDYTDGLALQAIRLVFAHLERSVKNVDFESREKMHNASTMAGMAFANAFLGISHSLSHKLGGFFHTVHGRTNAILLPYVIRYNGTRPAKTATWPKYNYYRADEKYQDIARLLGLPAATPEEGVQSLAQAVYDLGERVGIKMNFRDQGIKEQDYMQKTEEIAYLAYEDQCTPANPRLAVVSDLKEILEDAYYGYKERPGRLK